MVATRVLASGDKARLIPSAATFPIPSKTSSIPSTDGSLTSTITTGMVTRPSSSKSRQSPLPPGWELRCLSQRTRRGSELDSELELELDPLAWLRICGWKKFRKGSSTRLARKNPCCRIRGTRSSVFARMISDLAKIA